MAWLGLTEVSGMALTDIECDADLGEGGYIVPDPVHCDRYLDCDPATGSEVRLCPAGQGVDLVSGVCQHNVDCGSRKMLWRGQVNAESVTIENKLSTSEGSSLQTSATVPLVTSPNKTNDPLARMVCEKSDAGYTVPDPDQCDRYAVCSPEGVKTINLCPDGLALSLQTGVCDFLVVTDCQDRPKLQLPTGTGPCVRENGRYPVESCNQFLDCRSGQWKVQGCAVGVVFDPVKGCVHPDQTSRPGCRATDQFEVQCPPYGIHHRLRFGDHDRIPHPTDCKVFYACLRTGLPRLNTCPKPKVFNPKSGFCDDQKNVPGCEGEYVLEEKDEKFDREKITKEIREQLLKELGLSAKASTVRSDESVQPSPTVHVPSLGLTSMKKSRGRNEILKKITS